MEENCECESSGGNLSNKYLVYKDSCCGKFTGFSNKTLCYESFSTVISLVLSQKVSWFSFVSKGII
jgi:hypothetical protein